MKTLREARIGETVKVVKLHGEGPVKRRIMDMGITKGIDIYVRKVAPLGDPIEVTVRGYELTVSWKDSFKLAGKTFHYNASFLFSDYVSHITKFDNPDQLFAKTYWVGQKYGDIWGYHVDGLFASDAEGAAYDAAIDASAVNQYQTGGNKAGDVHYIDLDGNGKIEASTAAKGDGLKDTRVIGNSQPRFNYGINLGASWNGFDLTAFFQGIGHMDWYPAADARSFWGPFARPYQTFIPRDFHTMYWTEDHKDAYFPRPRGYAALNDNASLTSVNDRYLQNVAYCRVKNVTVGYSLPKKWVEAMKMQALRIYFTGDNLAYWAPGLMTSYVDPEQAINGGNLRVYSWMKTFMFGIDITF